MELYIAGLELEAYDLKQERAASGVLTTTLVGAAILYVAHFGGPPDSIWSYLGGLALMIFPWFVYRYEWRKNADANHLASENILMEWELHHLAKAKLAAKHRANDSSPT